MELLKRFSGIELRQNEGEDKVLELGEAIRRHLKPGMVIYIREGSYVAIREIIKQFADTKYSFTLVMVGCRDYALDLIHCGLVSKVITARFSESPTLGRSQIIRRAYEQNAVNIENWSLYSLSLRLMAGALGLPFFATKSILHSSMAQENRDSFVEIDDPFGRGEKFGLVKSLNPDIAFVHGWASDRNGNLIMAPTILSGENEWGAFASKGGIIATVERLVSTEFIRKHSLLVKIPGYFVKSVSVAPFGAHPQSLIAPSEEFDQYEADYEFMEKHRAASKASQSLDVWLKEWVMDCPGNDDYLRKLGYEHLAFLKGKAGKLSWKHKLSLEEITTTTEYSAREMMLVAASRIIKQKIIKNKYKVILSGIGIAGLAACLSYYELRSEGIDVELMVGSGLYGWAPRPGDYQLTSFSNLQTCKMITDTLHTYGIFAFNQCISVLGTVQLDKYGNMNLTKLSVNSYLAGSGGANDAANAREVILVLPQSRRGYVDSLPYITCSGRNVRTVVSDKGVLTKVRTGKELKLAAYFPNLGTSDQDKIVSKIKADCGWELKIHTKVKNIEPPNTDELALLRLLSVQRSEQLSIKGETC